MDSGQLGEVHLVTSQWLNYTANLRPSKLQGELDWNMWQGSAPKHEMDPQRYFNWYYYYDYSGGLIVGQAAHIIDCIQWYMNSNGPLTVTCSGLKPDLPGVEVTKHGNDSGRVPGELPRDIHARIQVDDVQHDQRSAPAVPRNKGSA